MTPPTEDLPVILPHLTHDQIAAQREEWRVSVASIAKTLVRLHQELTTNQQQEIALNGAIQACDVFLKKLTPQTTT